MKSYCIKTQNEEIIEYLLNKLSKLDFPNISYCKKSFKIYYNLIMHYKEEDTEKFENIVISLIIDVIIEFYENNKDKNYVYIYNPVNPKISRKTDAILINLYKNYIAKDDEKEKINHILKLNEIKNEQEKQENFDLNNIFNNKKSEIKNNNVDILPVEKKRETRFKKFIDKIKKIFNI